MVVISLSKDNSVAEMTSDSYRTGAEMLWRDLQTSHRVFKSVRFSTFNRQMADESFGSWEEFGLPDRRSSPAIQWEGDPAS
jgi:hypothetical protein